MWLVLGKQFVDTHRPLEPTLWEGCSCWVVHIVGFCLCWFDFSAGAQRYGRNVCKDKWVSERHWVGSGKWVVWIVGGVPEYGGGHLVGKCFNLANLTDHGSYCDRCSCITTKPTFHPKGSHLHIGLGPSSKDTNPNIARVIALPGMDTWTWFTTPVFSRMLVEKPAIVVNNCGMCVCILRVFIGRLCHKHQGENWGCEDSQVAQPLFLVTRMMFAFQSLDFCTTPMCRWFHSGWIVSFVVFCSRAHDAWSQAVARFAVKGCVVSCKYTIGERGSPINRKKNILKFGPPRSFKIHQNLFFCTLP